jgi:hypothetical protein
MSSEHPMPPAGDVPASVRAQILATEHWSLLATRGMTWSEVMSRISIQLTIASASLVVLALVAQASGFGTAFQVLSIGLASAVLVLGTLTAVRVHNASTDDAAMLLGMNRLRSAYLELDPSLERYLVTSPYDDLGGLMRSYTMGMPRSMVSHVVGSTSFFVGIVNSIVAGALGALIADAAGGGSAVVAVVGPLSGLGYFGIGLLLSSRAFSAGPPDVRFPGPP